MSLLRSTPVIASLAFVPLLVALVPGCGFEDSPDPTSGLPDSGSVEPPADVSSGNADAVAAPDRSVGPGSPDVATSDMSVSEAAGNNDATSRDASSAIDAGGTVDAGRPESGIVDSGTDRGTPTAMPPASYPPVPTPQQLAWQENELTIFLHFGMDTFGDPHLGTGMEDPNLFNPTALDCAQWAQAAKDAGFKGMILTAKHHDGFCLWPTATTPHSVKSSSWKNGTGDVVKEFTDAAKAAGLKAGIYCSPWDRNHQALIDSDPAAYSTMYEQQLTELMSNYGDIFEMWFDGTHAPTTAWPDILNVVRTRQPNAIIKQGPAITPIHEDIRWVGNEQARAPLTNWSVYPPPGADAGGAQRIWFPVESDIPMIGSWFWDGNPPISLAKLLDVYYISVGRNSQLLLNVAPDKRGLFSDDSVARLKEFRNALDTIFNTDLTKGAKITAANVRGNDPFYGPDKMLDGDKATYWATDDNVTSSSFEVDWGAEKQFNVVRTEELVGLGQRVQQYMVEAYSTAGGGAWKTIVNGTTIGYRKLDRFPVVTASKVRLTIQKSLATPTIRGFGVHYDTISPPDSFLPANALK